MKRSIRRLGAFQRYKGGVSCSTTSMSSIFTKSPLWSIAPLRRKRNLFFICVGLAALHVYTGPKFAIDAIAAGKQGAILIHRFVQPRVNLMQSNYIENFQIAVEWFLMKKG